MPAMGSMIVMVLMATVVVPMRPVVLFLGVVDALGLLARHEDARSEIGAAALDGGEQHL